MGGPNLFLISLYSFYSAVDLSFFEKQVTNFSNRPAMHSMTILFLLLIFRYTGTLKKHEAN